MGIDLCEIARVRRSLARFGERFMAKVLCEEEITYCQRQGDVAQSFAGRFAAKEATVKALGGGQGLRWQDLQVLPANDAPPQMLLLRHAKVRADAMGVDRVHLTITHDAGMALAFVIFESQRS